MRENQQLKIVCPGVILVPYRACHVPKYHEWMQSEELLELTASERLTLEEEGQNQISWAQDPNKCTFIILDKKKLEDTSDEIHAMIGDVNMFFAPKPSTEDTVEAGEGIVPSNGNPRYCAEIEIMIAEVGARGKGFGKQSILAMILYGYEKLGVQLFTAKIGMANAASQLLFTGKLGFVKTGQSDYFKEVHLELQPADEWALETREKLGEFRVEDYHNDG